MGPAEGNATAMVDVGEVRVSDHLFGIVDRGGAAIETADWSNGLLIALAPGALIYTGIDSGRVRVTVDVVTKEPSYSQAGDWDDVVEASVLAPHGELGVHHMEYLDEEEPPALPLLSPHGAGSYRIRAHARGRDRYFDTARDASGEEYLLQVWPAAPVPTLIIRATDQCGYGLRVSRLQQLTPLAPSRDDRRAFLKQATLENVDRHTHGK